MAQPPGRAPRLSVIIPFYDETAFVAMAVGSVFAQGIAGAEVILVNDNPDTFDADAIAALALPAAVRVVHMPANGGLSAARNEFAAGAMGLMHGLARRFWYLHYRQAADLPETARLHADTARAIADGDEAGAAKALDALLDSIESFTRATVSTDF